MRAVIFGNSGSGKSTLAMAIGSASKAAILDLDTVAWVADASTPIRCPLEESTTSIERFIESSEDWVIEGCYSDLIEVALAHATHAVFLNPGVEACVANARSRPWESHKYESREAQDENLAMLIDWIRDYPRRDDEFSLNRHRALFNSFRGRRYEATSNDRESWFASFIAE